VNSRWSDRDATETVGRYTDHGVSEDLALRVYSARLLGSDPALVLHGGGNTSVKTVAIDAIGDSHEVICVKGSGWDMATIEPAGHPAVKLASLRRLRALKDLRDEEMVNQVRLALLDSAAPTPSIETLLHAFLPHKFVDHTHANAVLSLVDQADSAAIAAEVWGEDMAFLPYIMPGFALSKAAADAFEAEPSVKGLILDKHGIFTFADTARESYELMIEMVSRAEARIHSAGPKMFPARKTAAVASLGNVAPVLRGALAEPLGGGAWRRVVLAHRADDAVMKYVDGADIAFYAARGVVTPDHIIRTKNRPLIAPVPALDDVGGFVRDLRHAVNEYALSYRRYFDANNVNAGDAKKTMLDPVPRVVLMPGIGLFGVGRSAREAAVAADIAEATARTVTDAEAAGRYTPLPETELFRMEYWSLEQAKLSKTAPKALQGQVVAVTGGAGTIGLATARLFAANGAEVALLDVDERKATETAAALGAAAQGIACDVTDRRSVTLAFETIVSHWGGVDILVSNAGAAWQGRIGEVDDAVLRKSFELNFFGHQNVAQAAVKIMLAQGTGGALLFNVSKQAVNPGANFGPYGLPKAATLFLSRQYALDYGAFGIRSNAVNADRIRSGLLDDEMIAERAQARGLTEDNYMSGNLLGLEVTADDVAQAFLHQALALKTTAGVTTIDGGNIAAAMR
jgi:rhamnose utilization protein RhaD (predicted bifunctional aldolase and dehydrogenase)/NAD(P)-dependent dehydrogenase (short-subunit alcohol dehydrogenase family)